MKMTAYVNRADLAWALSAVLPHVGKWPFETVGIQEGGGKLLVWASDRYTVGIARLPFEGVLGATVALSAKEARELERYVRIGRKADEQETVALLNHLVDYGYHGSYNDEELNLGLLKPEESDPYDSAVCLQVPHCLRADHSWDDVSRVLSTVPERLGPETREYTYSPGLLARFKAAQRAKEDRLRMFPYAVKSKVKLDYTLALVTVGDNFLGAICGMVHEPGVDLILASWFKEAA